MSKMQNSNEVENTRKEREVKAYNCRLDVDIAFHITYYRTRYTQTPWLDLSTFLPDLLSPSSNINQQA